MEKGSLSKIKKDNRFVKVKYIPILVVVVPIDSIKNLKEWSITASVISIIGATLLGGTFLGHTLPLIFGSVGATMIGVGILIEVIKFGHFIKEMEKKGKVINI
jgi:hypothetical protein